MLSDGIKAIETEYNGYRFRSRLEARWAVFFDAMNIQYAYEEEGFEKYIGDQKEKYLPDFRLGLPGSGIYAEVKGDNTELTSNSDALTELHDFGGILPGFSGSLGTPRGLLLLGEIPLPNNRLVLHPIMQHEKGIWRSFAVFRSGCWYPIDVIRGDSLSCLFDVEPSCDPGWDNSPRLLSVGRFFPRTQRAYLEARSARFEHGECGSVLR